MAKLWLRSYEFRCSSFKNLQSQIRYRNKIRYKKNIFHHVIHPILNSSSIIHSSFRRIMPSTKHETPRNNVRRRGLPSSDWWTNRVGLKFDVIYDGFNKPKKNEHVLYLKNKGVFRDVVFENVGKRGHCFHLYLTRCVQHFIVIHSPIQRDSFSRRRALPRYENEN